MSEDRPTQVTVDGLQLNNVESSGLEWKFTSIDGWHDGPATFVEQEQRIGHGQFAQPGRRGGKTMTINGRIIAIDRALVAAAVTRLAALLADGQFGELEIVDRTEGPRRAPVQLLAAPQIVWAGGPVAMYQVQLLAPSPYKFGATSAASTPFGVAPVGAGLVFPLFDPPATMNFGPQGSTGVVAIGNQGTADSSVRFTVVGPTPTSGFTITDTTTAKSIRYLGVVPAGSQLILDGSNGTVVIDGTADRLGDTIVEAWPKVPAGGSREFLFAPLSTATAAVLTAETVATYW